MADIKQVNVNGTTYDIKDALARNLVRTASSSVSTLAALKTLIDNEWNDAISNDGKDELLSIYIDANIKLDNNVTLPKYSNILIQFSSNASGDINGVCIDPALGKTYTLFGTVNNHVVTINACLLEQAKKGLNDHIKYSTLSNTYNVLATTSSYSTDYAFASYPGSSNVSIPTSINTNASLLDGKFSFQLSIDSTAFTNSVGTQFRLSLAVGRKFIVDSLNEMLGTGFGYGTFKSHYSGSNPIKVTEGLQQISFSGEPGVEEIIGVTAPIQGNTFYLNDNTSISSVRHYNGYYFSPKGYVLVTISAGTHSMGVTIFSGTITLDLTSYLASQNY